MSYLLKKIYNKHRSDNAFVAQPSLLSGNNLLTNINVLLLFVNALLLIISGIARRNNLLSALCAYAP